VVSSSGSTPSSVALAGEGVELYKVAVRLLGERVHRDQTAGVLDAEAVFAAIEVDPDQGAQHFAGGLAQVLLLGHEPLLELGAVLEEEAGEQLAAVEVGHLDQAVRRGLPVVGGSLAERCAEGVHVEPQLGRRVYPEAAAVGEQKRLAAAVGQGLLEVVDRLAQVAARALVVALGPQQAGKLLPGEGAVAVEDEVGEQRPHLLRLEPLQQAAAVPHLEAAEQEHPELAGAAHLGSSPGRGAARHRVRSELPLPVTKP